MERRLTFDFPTGFSLLMVNNPENQGLANPGKETLNVLVEKQMQYFRILAPVRSAVTRAVCSIIDNTTGKCFLVAFVNDYILRI